MLFSEQEGRYKGYFYCHTNERFYTIEEFFKLLETDFPDKDWEKRISTNPKGLKDYFLVKK